MQGGERCHLLVVSDGAFKTGDCSTRDLYGPPCLVFARTVVPMLTILISRSVGYCSACAFTCCFGRSRSRVCVRRGGYD